MAVRIKEPIPPYVGGTAIEITDNHVINLLLREANNLIHLNENNEIYVDLQLDDGIQPDDDFPVGVTTGKILEEDWWQQSWLILNRKTTSGDYNRLIYANDGNLYIDYGDGVWHLIWEGGSLFNCNTRTFYLPELSDVSYIQEAYDYFLSWKNPILWYDRFGDGNHGEMFVYGEDSRWWSDPYIMFAWTHLWWTSWESRWTAQFSENRIKVYVDPQDMNTVIRATYIDGTLTQTWFSFIPTDTSLREPFIPTAPSHPTSKKYVDDELAKKQDILTPGTRITITYDPISGNTIISADISGVMTYKGNLQSVSDLSNIQNPSVWDCYYIEWAHTMYAWDWTQWNDVGGTGIDLTNYFNKQTDTTDNITQGSTNLFVTQQEKNDWNDKQDKIQAWNNITIDADGVTINAVVPTAGNNISIVNNQINNDAPFDPENAWVMGQVLQKTNSWYKWVNINLSNQYTAGAGINIDQNNEISNTLPFNPDNQGSENQVLKKTQNWYEWQAESVTSVNGQTGVVLIDEFSPDNQGQVGQVLKKTQNWYEWQNESWGGGAVYTPWYWINIDQNNEISNSLAFDPDNQWTVGQVLKKTQNWYERANESGWGGGTTYYGGTWITIDSWNYINNDWILTINNSWPDSSGDIQLNLVPSGGNVGQVLKRTSNWYERANESWGGWNTYYAGTGISISSSNYISNDWVLTINSNSPDNSGNIDIREVPSGGTAGDVLTKTQNWYSWEPSPGLPSGGTAGQILMMWSYWQAYWENDRIKIFDISGESDLTNAQLAYDFMRQSPWYYQAGAYVSIIRAYKSDRMNWWYKLFVFNGTENYSESWASYTCLIFNSVWDENVWYSDGSTTRFSFPRVTLFVNNATNTVDRVLIRNFTVLDNSYLATGINYTTPYIPQYPWNPATKQYVDDRNRVGTQAQYNALTTIDPNVIYNITA